jgi:starch synthase
MKVLFIAAEATPYIKVGGLGDVMGGLPKALIKLGVDARVVIPLYSQIKESLRADLKFVKALGVPLGWRICHCGIFEGEINGVKYYFIDNEQYFKRDNVYGEFDDAERFAFFSKAALEIFPHIDFYPDVINANDWHTALVPLYLNAFYRNIKFYKEIKTVLSIHNIEFQGQYDPLILGHVLGLDVTYRSILMYNGCLNILKAGIESANVVTTVSKNYANEILDPYFSHGLHNILQPRQYKLKGIVNGIDTDLFDPKTDSLIPYNYDYQTIRFKTSNKKAFQKEMGLEVSATIPIIGMVTRLTPQKGLDLIKEVMPQIVEMDMQLIVLGTGFSEYEEMMKYWEDACGSKVRGIIKFSNELASNIYAASDLFLMPSKSEPCGLAQMIAMRYGTIPIVHTVGGLKETVMPYDPATKVGNGITFQSYEALDMLDAIKRGLDLYQDKNSWRNIRKNAMSTDFCWNISAKEYMEVYEGIE